MSTMSTLTNGTGAIGGTYGFVFVHHNLEKNILFQISYTGTVLKALKACLKSLIPD